MQCTLSLRQLSFLLLIYSMLCVGCMNSVMTQVMDPSQASGQIQLLTELHSRFPEVPVDIIKVIMQQVSTVVQGGCCDTCKHLLKWH